MARPSPLLLLGPAAAFVVLAATARGQEPGGSRRLPVSPPVAADNNTLESDAPALLAARLAAAERAAAAAWEEADAASAQVRALEDANGRLRRELEAQNIRLETARQARAAAAAEDEARRTAAAGRSAEAEAADSADALGAELAAARDEIAALHSRLARLEDAGGALGWVERRSDLVIPGLLLTAALLALGWAHLRRRRAARAAQAGRAVALFVPKTQPPSDPGAIAPARGPRPPGRAAPRAAPGLGSPANAPRRKPADGAPAPDGPALARQARAAGLDRLAFAALYLRQVAGETGGDPERFAAALRLFESPGGADARPGAPGTGAREVTDL